jgi:hypothetical protein
LYNKIILNLTSGCPIPGEARQYYTDKLLNGEWNALLHVGETGEWLLNKDISSWKNKDKKIAIIVADTTYKKKLSSEFRDHLFYTYRIDPDSLSKFRKDKSIKPDQMADLENILQFSRHEIFREIKKIKGLHLDKKDIKVSRSNSIYFLPWWLHNQHMSIFIKRLNDGSWRITNSIYFTRRLRSSNINPVLLENLEDNNSIHESFSAYMIEAEKANFNIISRTRVLKRIAELKKIRQ